MSAERFSAAESAPSPENKESLGIDFFVSDHYAEAEGIPLEQDSGV